MADLDEEFQAAVAEIQEGKANFPENEQSIIENWVQKFLELDGDDEEKTIRNMYAQTLARLTTADKELSPPFSEQPPPGNLRHLQDIARAKKYSFQPKLLTCSKSAGAREAGAAPRTKKQEKKQQPQVLDTHPHNEFADPEEMARVIANSKGQSFADFVVSIGRHTADYGQELRTVMTSETSSFREYVDNVLSQRIKDLTEVLDKEQNRELMRIKMDVERWQLELANVKRRIKEMIPMFDIDLYRKDRNYLKKLFTIEPVHGMPEDDSFKRIKEEHSHRLKWIYEMTSKMTRCNEQLKQEIAKVESDTLEMETKEATKCQNFLQQINCEMNSFQLLKLERDRLYREHSELLSELKHLTNT